MTSLPTCEKMVEVQGLEPWLTKSKFAVLPLHHTSAKMARRVGIEPTLAGLESAALPLDERRYGGEGGSRTLD